MNKKEERMMRILELLKINKSMSIQELSEIFDVTPMTIRRDLEFLKNHNSLERSYGKATYQYEAAQVQEGKETYDLPMERVKRYPEKERICQEAAKLLQPNDAIIIDNGTTTSHLTKYIPKNEPFTVVCYNFNVFAKLREDRNIQLILSGGYYYPEDQMFTSKENVEFIRNIRANKVFLSASGFHKTLGLTCIHAHEKETKEAAIQSSAQRILLMDSSKFGLVRSTVFAAVNEIDILITDSGISEDYRRFIEDSGIQLIIV